VVMDGFCEKEYLIAVGCRIWIVLWDGALNTNPLMGEQSEWRDFNTRFLSHLSNHCGFGKLASLNVATRNVPATILKVRHQDSVL
jgi:hypothetical protein